MGSVAAAVTGFSLQPAFRERSVAVVVTATGIWCGLRQACVAYRVLRSSMLRPEFGGASDHVIEEVAVVLPSSLQHLEFSCRLDYAVWGAA